MVCVVGKRGTREFWRPPRAWTRWLLRVGLPCAGLFAVASIVPTEQTWERSAAQLAAVGVPLGIELLRGRWEKGQDRDRALSQLGARLASVEIAVPDRLRQGLDDPAFRVTPFWGRKADLQRLNAARLALPKGGLILVTGPAWVGKTRLLTEWALSLPSDVLTGWLREGTAEKVVEQAIGLGHPVVMLQRAKDAETLAALNALGGGQDHLLLVVEGRDASHLLRLARAESAAAGRLVEAAQQVVIANPGRPSDLEHRFSEMRQAYAKVAGTLTPGRHIHSLVRWTSEPIGLVSSLAMMAALGNTVDSPRPSHLESLQSYWAGLISPWLRERPAQSFGLPTLSDLQLETAVVAELLTDGRSSEVIHHLSLFEVLDQHRVAQLARWAHEVARPALGTSMDVAALAATQVWSDADRTAMATALRAGTPDGLVHAIRHCLFAEEVLNMRLAITGTLVSEKRPMTVPVRLYGPARGVGKVGSTRAAR